MSGLKEPEELEPAQGSLDLASPDDTYGASDWEAAAAAVLRKARRLGEDAPDSAVWEVLTRTTLDGVEVPPIGSRDQVADLATSGRPERAGDWDVRTHLAGPDARTAHEAALVDLENGATSLWVELGSGLAVADLPTLLEDVLLDLAPVVLDAATDAVAAARALTETAAARGTTLHRDTNLGADPIGDTDDLVTVARLARDTGVRGVVVDAVSLHERGASDAQELGYSVAAGAAALRVLTGAGFSLAEALDQLEFRYAATDEQLPTIAKLRAARRLWARVVEVSGGDATRQRQHVVTSRPMMTRYDPWVNMLRGTVAAFAAGVGGAEAVTVMPFDSPLGVPDGFGRRIARNTSSLLIAESHLARVTDPAGGSFAVERLTDDLARAGWAELGRIEEVGGVVAALADGSVQERVDAVVAERERQVAHRTRPITGVSEFPHLAEVLPERAPQPGTERIHRYAAAWEALRDDPATTPVFLATLGPVAAHTARATFATNLLAAGGVPVVAAGGTDDPQQLLAAYSAPDGGQPVVCLAGSDATYAEWGAAAATLLREAGARRVVLAGTPGERTVPADLVDDSCAVGDDALAFLTRTREALL